MAQALDEQFALRGSLARFATGVTVVTCCDRDGTPCGITVNSFSSVSLSPPLVLWSIADTCTSLDAFLAADRFSIHVLRDTQLDLSEHFARSDHTLFDGVEYRIGEHGVPLLPDPLARFDCRTWQIYAGGDHRIIVGEVVAHQHGRGDPLLYYQSAYRRIDGS